ncbi:hypothetical protein HOH87_03235 [bacterium]|nr:hypothetical protein [bacterium]
MGIQHSGSNMSHYGGSNPLERAHGALRGTGSNSIPNRVLTPEQKLDQVHQFLGEITKLSHHIPRKGDPLNRLLGVMRKKEIPEINAALTQSTWMGKERSPLGKIVVMFEKYATKGIAPQGPKNLGEFRKLVKAAERSAEKVLKTLPKTELTSYEDIVTNIEPQARELTSTTLTVNTTLKGSYSPLNYGERIVVEGDLAAVSDKDKIRLIDLSNDTPLLLGSIQEGSIDRLAMKGDRIGYLKEDRAYFVDVSNPNIPVPMGSLYLESPEDLKIVGNTAIVSVWGGIEVLDISQGAPVVNHSFDMGEGANLFEIEAHQDYGHVAYVVSGVGRLHTVAIPENGTPYQLGSSTENEVLGYSTFTMTIGTGYVSVSGEGARRPPNFWSRYILPQYDIYDTTNLTAPVLRDRYTDDNTDQLYINQRDIESVGNFVVMSSDFFGVLTVSENVADGPPMRVGVIDEGQYYSEAAIGNGRVYGVTDTGLKIYQVDVDGNTLMDSPTAAPSGQPSTMPTAVPSGQPSRLPTGVPSAVETGQPSGQPIAAPSGAPSPQPSSDPTSFPSKNDTETEANMDWIWGVLGVGLSVTALAGYIYSRMDDGKENDDVANHADIEIENINDGISGPDRDSRNETKEADQQISQTSHPKPTPQLSHSTPDQVFPETEGDMVPIDLSISEGYPRDNAVLNFDSLSAQSSEEGGATDDLEAEYERAAKSFHAQAQQNPQSSRNVDGVTPYEPIFGSESSQSSQTEHSRSVSPSLKSQDGLAFAEITHDGPGESSASDDREPLNSRIRVNRDDLYPPQVEMPKGYNRETYDQSRQVHTKRLPKNDMPQDMKLDYTTSRKLDYRKVLSEMVRDQSLQTKSSSE